MQSIPKELKDLFKAAGIQKGSTVVEFGIGKRPHLALHLAGLVGNKGQVYAVDSVYADLEMIRKHSADRRIHNLKTVHGDFESVGGSGVPDHSADMIVSAHNAWRVHDFDVMLKEAERILKPTGKILLLDWHANTSDPIAPASLRRLDLLEAQRICAASGCSHIERAVNTTRNWGLILHYK